MKRVLLPTLLASSALVPFVAQAQSLPSGGAVVRGAAEIGAATPAGLDIRQTSNRAVINWTDFSIGEGQQVTIAQPDAQAALLSRVTGDATSVIAGRLSANGQVYLVNPNGIQITESGTVDAAGFVASTLDIADADFMAGRLRFLGAGGTVVNAGRIGIVRGGYAALLGGEVDSSGLIVAPLGRVAIGGGTRATLDFGADGFLQVALDEDASSRIVHSGSIDAIGGAVILQAASAREAARATVNLAAAGAATSVTRHGSDVILGGTIAARDGGSIAVTGDTVALTGATIDVSGATGGGTVRIGGGREGGETLAHASRLSVDGAARIAADATRSGNGGDVVLWSDEATGFAGTISARGAGGGNGGEAEVSSKGVLDYRGTTDLTGGAFGTLLLDPRNITISTGADSGAAGFVATADDSVINVTTLTNALKTANVTVSTGSTGTQAGNITVTTPISWTTSATLTLKAAGNIDINGAITAQAGTLNVNAGGTSGGTGAIGVAKFINAAGDWRQIGTGLADFTAADFRINGGTFVRALGGDGSAATPYQLTDIYGFQGIAGFASGNYTLAGNIDASGTANWNDGGGFRKIDYGRDDNGDIIAFSGSIDGKNHSVTGLRQRGSGLGIFDTFGGALKNIVFSGYDISGSDTRGGAFATKVANADITNVHFDGSFRVANYAGGLAYEVSNSNLDGVSLSGDVTTNNGWGAGFIYSIVDSSISNFYVNTHVTSTWAKGFADQLDHSFYSQQTSVITNGYVTGSNTATFVSLISSNDGTIGSTLYYNQPVYGSSPGTGLTGAQMRDATNFVGFDFTNTWYQAGDMRPILRGEAAPVASDGVYEISTLKQLQLINAAQTYDYRLIADIDMSATDGSDARSIWGPGGWIPLIHDGGFDGRLHTLSNLTINRGSAPDQALFARTTGSVDNLRLENVSVTGENYSSALIGTLDPGGTVSNIWVAGAVTSVGGVPGAGSGGLFGRLRGSADNVHFSGTVTAAKLTGGIAGLATGSLTHSSFDGTITLTNASAYAGGLVGDAEGTISDSFATGRIDAPATNNIGGLAGSLTGTLTGSWAAMTINAGSVNVGALVGYSNVDVGANYWDSDVAGVATGVGYIEPGGSDGTVALTTSQARSAASYAGFDFNTVWYRSGDMRPILRSELVTRDGIGQVFNIRQLQLIDTNWNGSYALIADIDASATQGLSASGIWSTGGFMGIADVGSGLGFHGELDGRGHAITGFSQTATNARTFEEQGMFARSSGLLHDFSISGTNTSSSTAQLTGGVVANISGATGIVRNVTSNVDVTINGTNYRGGGIAGLVSGTIENSRSLGDVTGATVGGIAGLMAKGTIRNSSASGTISSNGSAGGAIGGVVGSFVNGEVSNVYIDATVQNTVGRGGLLFGTAASSGTISGVFLNGTINESAQNNLVSFDAIDANSPILYNSDKVAASLIASNTTAAAVGYTTAQLRDRSTYQTVYSGFDFANTWVVPNQSGQGGDATAHVAELRALNDVVIVGTGGTVRTYGQANGTFVTDYRGLNPGDYLGGRGTFTSGATATSNVGDYAATLAGTTIYSAGGTSYRIVNLVDTLTVAPRRVIVSPDAASRVYGDANPSFAYTVEAGGLINGDSLTGALGTTATVLSDVGAYGITQGSLTAGSNYVLDLNPATLTITRAPATVTYTAFSRSSAYGDPLANMSISIWIEGRKNDDGFVDVVTGFTTIATTATTTSDVGIYAITGSGLSAVAGNYDVTFRQAASNATAYTITPRLLTVEANPLARAYGDANPALGYRFASGSLVNGDTLSGALATTATSTSNVGTYAITQGSLAADSNYTLTFAGADLTVTPRVIGVTADAHTRIYGDANPALTYALTSGTLVNGDTLSGALATGATAASGVGAYAITQGSLTAGSNYTLAYTGADLTVTPRTIGVTADARTRIYGDANPALTYALTSGTLVNGDALSGALATGATATSGVGSYAITQGSLTAGSNYALAYTGADLTVTPRAIGVTADARTRMYGDADPALTYALTSGTLANGDTLSGALATGATATSGVGVYAIGQGSLTAGSNYTLAYTGADLTVTPRALTVTADALTRFYGDANPALTYTFTSGSLVNGDTLSGALATSATATSDVGTYGITRGTLAASANYALSFGGAALTVTRRPVTVTADSASRVYGAANPALTYTVGSLGAGVPLQGALSTTATTASPVGDYAITQGTLTDTANPNYAIHYVGAPLRITPLGLTVTITPDPVSRVYGETNPLRGTAHADNLLNGDTLDSVALASDATVTSGVGSYSLTPSDAQGTGLSNYTITYVTLADGLTVTPRAIAIVADPVRRAYGDANPALGYTLASGSLVNGDTLSGALATVATATSEVGGYAITRGTLAASSNYTLVYTGAALAVTPRPIAVIADSHSRIEGEPNPDLTFTVGGMGLVNGDLLSGALATDATPASAPGDYAIGQGTLSAGANYVVSFLPGTLAILADETKMPPVLPILVTGSELFRDYVSEALPDAEQPQPGMSTPSADPLGALTCRLQGGSATFGGCGL